MVTCLEPRPGPATPPLLPHAEIAKMDRNGSESDKHIDCLVQSDQNNKNFDIIALYLSNQDPNNK